MSNMQKLPRFRWWCHKIIPLIYDDSLSYYELLCKVIALLNEVIDTVNGFIDEDIEGYIKQLVDTYAREEIIRLIDEIGREELTDVIEEIAREAVDEFLNGAKNKLYGIESNKLNLNREYYIDGAQNNLYGISGHKADGFLITDDYYYFFAEKTIIRVNRTTLTHNEFVIGSYDGNKMGHVAIDGTHIYVSNGVTTIYRIPMATMVVDRVYSTNLRCGAIAYDESTDKFYARGAMASDTDADIYECVFDSINTATLTKIGELEEKQHLTVLQNMCAYDGNLYHLGSNPNCIIQTTLTGETVSTYTIDNRMDNILLVGEAQGICVNDGKVYVMGYASTSPSGKQHIWGVGYSDIGGGSITNSNNLQKTYAGIVYYVDSGILNGSSPVQTNYNIQDYPYSRYKATGWYGDYLYLPFPTLWEAVEACVGSFERTGVKGIIRVVDSAVKDSCSIPAYAINQISGFRPDTEAEIYWKCKGLNILGGSIEILRCGFIGMETDDIGYNTAGAMVACRVGANVKLTDCNFLYSANSPMFSNNTENMLYTTQGAYLEVGAIGDISNWSGYGEWAYEIDADNVVSHFGDISARFAYANSGCINLEANHDIQNTALFPLRLTRGGAFTGSLRMWNVGQHCDADTALVIPERTPYEYWGQFAIWLWAGTKSYCVALPVRGVTTHASRSEKPSFNIGEHSFVIEMDEQDRLTITPDFNCYIQIYLMKR